MMAEPDNFLNPLCNLEYSTLPRTLISESMAKYCCLEESEKTEEAYQKALKDGEQNPDALSIVTLVYKSVGATYFPEKNLLVPSNLTVGYMIRALIGKLGLEEHLCHIIICPTGRPKEAFAENLSFKEISYMNCAKDLERLRLDFIVDKSQLLVKQDSINSDKKRKRNNRTEQNPELNPEVTGRQVPRKSLTDSSCQNSGTNKHADESGEERETQKQVDTVLDNPVPNVAVSEEFCQEFIAGDAASKTRKTRYSVKVKCDSLLEEKLNQLSLDVVRNFNYVFVQMPDFSNIPKDCKLIWNLSDLPLKMFDIVATIRAIREYKMLCLHERGAPGTFLDLYYNCNQRPRAHTEMDSICFSRHISRWNCDKEGVHIPRLDKVKQMLLFFLSIGIPGETREDWEQMYGLLNWEIPKDGFPVINW